MTTTTNQPRVSTVVETIVDVGNLAERIIERHLITTGLSLAQLRILSLADGMITPGQLAAHLRQETHSVSGLLNRLEDNDLITRVRDRQDRRVVHIGLTHDGRALQANAMRLIEGVATEIEQLIGPGLRADIGEVRQDLSALYARIGAAHRIDTTPA